MEGWRLQKGSYMEESIEDDGIWQIFNYIFSSKSVNRTSYKFGFLKALLENVFNANHEGEISLEKIFYTFAHIYWSLIVKYNLKQGDKGVKGEKTSVEKIFDQYIAEYEHIKRSEFSLIKEEIQEKIAKSVLKECKKYVVGAIYGDSKGILYTFSLKDRYLKFHPNIFRFMKKYNHILLKLNHYEWIKFLEKVNVQENCYSIGIKLDEVCKRNDLKEYRNLLYVDLNDHHCFYCGRKVAYSKVHIDHFIPWSFIRNDRAWNLVVTCSKCNLSKNDKMAEKYYLEKLIDRDDLLIKHTHKLIQEDFLNYNNLLVNEIYEAAVFNGFEYGWIPKTGI